MEKDQEIVFINELIRKRIAKKIIFQNPNRQYNKYEISYLLYTSYVLTHLDNIQFGNPPIELITARKLFDQSTIPFLKTIINKDRIGKNIFETCFMIYDKLEKDYEGLKIIDRGLEHIVVPTLEEMGTLEKISVKYRVLSKNE